MSKATSQENDNIAQMYAAIVESSDDAILSKTLDGTITSWNKGAEAIYGYSRQEIIGKPIYTIVPADLHPEIDDILRRIKAGQRIDHYETRRLRKDGSEIEVSVTISPITNKAGEVVGASAIARDITEKKLLIRQRQRFLTMTSHELKTPITSLKMMAQILERQLEKSNEPTAAKATGTISQQLNRLTKLVDDLLDVSRSEQGRLQLNIEKFEIASLLREITERIATTTHHRLKLEAKNKVAVEGDPHRLEQVITNLLTNAIKYSPKAERVDIKLEKTDGQATITITDYGIGIRLHDQDKIFTPFYRAEGNDENKYPGLGIGLYISNEIVKRHGGNIKVESTPNKGSTFKVTLPIKFKGNKQRGNL